MIEHGTCDDCKHTKRSVFEYPCCTCGFDGNGHSNWEPQSNGDKIRNMTDEELATVMAESCKQCAFDSDDDLCRDNTCKAGYLAWLKQEAKHEDT